MKSLAVLLALVLTGAVIAAVRYDGSEADGGDLILRREHDRQVAIHLNEAAANIRTEADARALVDEIAELFRDTLPPAWKSAGVRDRVARAEFAVVSDLRQRIPEQRVADVWNEYVRGIGASDEALATAAEIHYLRDGLYITAQYAWEEGENRSLWTAPGFFAVEADGKVAEGCRALEALRILWDLDRSLENLRGARLRVQQGALFSDQFKWRLGDPIHERREMHFSVTPIEAQPVRFAEINYVKEHGQESISRLLAPLV